MLPRRLSRLREVEPGVRMAEGIRARLLGLAGLPAADCALLLPRCSCVHTFGLRFALDITFLDREGAVLRELHAVPPRRVVRCRGAISVLERPSAQAEPTSAARR